MEPGQLADRARRDDISPAAGAAVNNLTVLCS